MDKSKVLAIIPCYNSDLFIAKVVSDTLKVIDNVLVINDGSTDNSMKAAKGAGAEVFSLENNQGVGFATLKGMEIALTKKMDTIITLDSDGAHCPFEITDLLNQHKKSNNILTIGNRWSQYSPSIPSQKWWANFFAAILFNRLAKTNLSDVACGFRVYNRNLAEFLFNSNLSTRFGFIYEVVFIAKNLGKIGSSIVNVRYDANDFLGTPKGELLNFLEICIEHCQIVDTLSSINKIIEIVKKSRRGNLILNRINADPIFMTLIPVIEYSKYVFQWQNPIFGFSKGEVIEI